MTPMGFSGRIARQFQDSEITPLLALVGLLLGLFAVLITPREEEPQIDVTFANVFIPFPGASAREVEQLITTPADQVLSEIEGVKHIYSVSKPGMSLLSVEYQVGEKRTDAIVRLYNAIYSNQDWLPANLGVGPALIKPKGIDDVPIVNLTLWTRRPGGRRIRTRAGRPHDRSRVEARARHPRHLYRRRPGTTGPCHRGPAEGRGPERDAGRSTARTVRREPRAASRCVVSGNQEILVDAGTFLSQPDELERTGRRYRQRRAGLSGRRRGNPLRPWSAGQVRVACAPGRPPKPRASRDPVCFPPSPSRSPKSPAPMP